MFILKSGHCGLFDLELGELILDNSGTIRVLSATGPLIVNLSS